MRKDFDGWNKVKKRTNSKDPRLYNPREIWWCIFGVNIGTEQDGKNDWYTRPCVILRGFGPDACLVAPLTTSKHKNKFRIPVGSIDDRESVANISQMRTIDTRRLQRKLGFLDEELFSEIRKAARRLF